MTDIVIKTISEVLGTSINEDTSQDNCHAWTSLQHFIIIVALEDVFDISIEPEDMENMKNVKKIETIIKRYKQQKND